MKKVSTKNEELKKTNMELRRKLQDFQRVKSGSDKSHALLAKTQKKFESELNSKDKKITRLTEELEKLKFESKNNRRQRSDSATEDSKLSKRIIQENKKLE